MQGLPPLARNALVALALLAASLGYTYFAYTARLTAVMHGQAPPGMRFRETSHSIDLYLRELGEHRQLYVSSLRVDFANGMLFALAFTLVILWFASYLPGEARWPRILVVLPIMGGLADVAENIMMLRAISAFPAASPSLLPWATDTKLVAILLTLLAVAGLGAIAFRLKQLNPVTQVAS